MFVPGKDEHKNSKLIFRSLSDKVCMFVQVREAEAERKRKAEREKSFQPPPTKTDSKVDASKGAVGYIRRINTLV